MKKFKENHVYMIKQRDEPWFHFLAIGSLCVCVEVDRLDPSTGYVDGVSFGDSVRQVLHIDQVVEIGEL